MPSLPNEQEPFVADSCFTDILCYLRNETPNPGFEVIGAIAVNACSRFRDWVSNEQASKIDPRVLDIQAETVQRYVELFLGTLSPIRRLPVELLSEIFTLCVPVLPTGRRGLSDAELAALEVKNLARVELLALAQVSYHWRQVALGTPGLWSCIAADPDVWSKCTVASSVLLDFIRTALTRSASYPLCVRVLAEKATNHSAAVLELLVAHSHRWRDADIRIEQSQLHLLQPICGRLQTLEKLGLTTRASAVLMFRDAPRLREVVFWGLSSCRLQLPWTVLSSFRSCGGPVGACTALSYMSFLPSGSSSSFCISALLLPLTTLPHVTSLVGRFSLDIADSWDVPLGEGAIQRIWDSITFTGLRHLHLKPRRSHPAPIWHHGSFQALNTRSGFSTSLISLTIRVVITEQDLLETLSSLRAVEKLDISDLTAQTAQAAVITDAVLNHLTWTANQNRACPLPSLHRLYLRSILGFSDQCLVDFGENRAASLAADQGPPKRLAILGVNYAHHKRTEMSQRLRVGLTKLKDLSGKQFTFVHWPMER